MAKRILNVHIQVDSSSYDVNLEDDLSFSEDNINQAYIDQPVKFAWWATIAAQTKATIDQKKIEVERQEDFLKKTVTAELDIKVRRQLAEEGERVTEARVNSAIISHPDYKQAQQDLYSLQDELLDLTKQYNLIIAAKEAMIQRKDMLISLGAQLRQKFSNEE